ncbi:MAG: hypothetical protein Q8876_10210, partial [Bacillota bacterium]|nr:hypothetical protein [Bacillota bacterium]
MKQMAYKISVLFLTATMLLGLCSVSVFATDWGTFRFTAVDKPAVTAYEMFDYANAAAAQASTSADGYGWVRGWNNDIFLSGVTSLTTAQTSTATNISSILPSTDAATYGNELVHRYGVRELSNPVDLGVNGTYIISYDVSNRAAAGAAITFGLYSVYTDGVAQASTPQMTFNFDNRNSGVFTKARLQLVNGPTGTTSNFVYDAGTTTSPYYTVKIKIEAFANSTYGDKVSAKVFPRGDVEPSDWQLSGLVSGISGTTKTSHNQKFNYIRVVNDQPSRMDNILFEKYSSGQVTTAEAAIKYAVQNDTAASVEYAKNTVAAMTNGYHKDALTVAANNLTATTNTALIASEDFSSYATAATMATAINNAEPLIFFSCFIFAS